jgi:tetratricopeptide (TPR) repeat protein
MAVRSPAVGRMPMKLSKYSHFEFLLDTNGQLLKTYLEDEEKDPLPMDLVVQLFEKSFAIASSAFAIPPAQDSSSGELKTYEARRIRQPILLALTLLAHLKWNLELIGQSVPLFLQMAIFEELLRGYDVEQFPNAENFKPDEMPKRKIMVHLLFNRWVVNCITKFVEMREKDFANANLPPGVKDFRDIQDHQILEKLGEYLPQSLLLLEKVSKLSSDLEMPLPIVRMIKRSEESPPIVGDDETTSNVVSLLSPVAGEVIAVKGEEDSNDEEETGKEKVVTESSLSKECEEVPVLEADKPTVPDDIELGPPMPIPSLLDIPIPINFQAAQAQVYFDLGSYYFASGNHSKALSFFSKACEIAESNSEVKCSINYDNLNGYYDAARSIVSLTENTVSQSLPLYECEFVDLNVALVDSARYGYRNVEVILKKDNITRQIPFSRRIMIQSELATQIEKIKTAGETITETESLFDLFFSVCALNYICSAINNRCTCNDFLKSLKHSTVEQLKLYIDFFTDAYQTLTNNSIKKRLFDSVKLSLAFLNQDQLHSLRNLGALKMFDEEKDIGKQSVNTAKKSQTVFF